MCVPPILNVYKQKNDKSFIDEKTTCRGERIRTSDPLLPNNLKTVNSLSITIVFLLRLC